MTLPIKEAKAIAQTYGWDQVVIIARKTGEGGYEHVVTYGKGKAHCEAAARAGNAIKHHLMQWPAALYDSSLRVLGISRDKTNLRSLSVALSDRPTDDDIRMVHELLKPNTSSPAEVDAGA